MSPEEKLIISKKLKKAILTAKELTKVGEETQLVIHKIEEIDSPQNICESLNVYKFVKTLEWSISKDGKTVPVDVATVTEFNKLKHIRALDMEDVTFDALAAFHIPQLEVLRLHETVIDEKGLDALAKLPNLVRLDLDHCKFSAKALEKLSSLSHLTELTIADHSGGITQNIMSEVVKLPSLASLKIGESPIEPEALVELKHLPELSGFTISWPASPVDVTALKPLTKLRSLTLSNIPRDSDILEPLREMKELRNLTINGCDIDSDLMKEIGECIKAMPRLKTLDIENNRIKDGMESLLGHPRLYELKSEGNEIPADTQAKLDEMLKVNLKQEQDAKALDRGKDVAGARQEREARMLRIASIAAPNLARIDPQLSDIMKSNIKDARAKLITAMVDGANTDGAIKELKEAHISTAVGMIVSAKERAAERDIQAITDAKQEYYSKGAGAVSQR